VANKDTYQLWVETGKLDEGFGFIKECSRKLVTQIEMCKHLGIINVNIRMCICVQLRFLIFIIFNDTNSDMVKIIEVEMCGLIRNIRIYISIQELKDYD